MCLQRPCFLHYSYVHYSRESITMNDSRKARSSAEPGDEGIGFPLGELPFQILLSLGTGPAHGYGIGKEIEERTDGRLRPTTGSLYQALKRLVDGGLIERESAADKSSPDRRRNYFRLTDRGRRAAALEAGRLHRLVMEARRRKLYVESV